MTKLGMQLKAKQVEQQQGRETRKQRVAKVQEEKRFESLKSQARKIREERFRDKVVQETYTQEVPDWTKINNPSLQRRFGGKEKYVQDRLIEKWRKEGKTTTVTKQRDKVIPFTLEDAEGDGGNSYKDVYDTLSPDLKQFFDTPKVVLEKKAKRIQSTKDAVAEKIAYADQKIAERKEYYERKEQNKRDWWSRKSSKYRSDAKNRERYKGKLNDYEDDLDEDVAKWQGYKKGLSKASQQLDKNKDVTFKSIESYAWDVSSYEENREEAKNKNRNIYNEAKRRGELDETFEQLGLEKSKTSYSEFSKGIKEFNKGVEDRQRLIDYGERVGFDKLSKEQQIKVNPDLAQWQWENKDEKLLFKGLTPIGVESGAFKQSFSIDNYQKVTSPEYIYAEWQKKNQPPKPTSEVLFQGNVADFSPLGNVGQSPAMFKKLTAGKELPVDYGHQGTSQVDAQGDFVAPTVIMGMDDYNKIKADPSTPFKDIVGGVVGGAKWIDERVNWDFKFGGSPSFPKVQVVTFGKKDTLAEQKIDQASEYLGDKKQSVEEWVLGKDKIDKFDEDIKSEYQSKYQYQFEQKYMKDILFNKTDFETASSEFEESAEAKALQKQFEKEYGEGYKDLQTVTANPLKEDFWRGRVVGGVASTGLSLGQLGLGIVKTPTRVVGAGAVVYTGGAVLGAVPTAVSLGLSGGLFAYGTYKFLDPSSTYIEAGGGLVTSVIAGATLGYAGVKYLRSPVVKRVAIKPPKATLKSTSVVGKDIKIIKDGVETSKVVYQSQKLSQISRAGSRTVVTTKGRVLSNKFWKKIGVPAKHTSIDSNAIYRGVPTQQLGNVRDYGILRITTKSGYQRAINLLKKYGWSDAQAKSTLRYTAPRIYESYLNKGIISVKDTKATAYFEHLVKRPVLDIDKSLGIKTRGGATLKDITKIQRQLMKDASGNMISKYSGIRVSGFVDKVGKFKDLKEVELISGKTFIKSFDRKGFEYLGKHGGVDAWRSSQAYKDIFAISKKNALRLKISKTSAGYKLNVDYNPARKLMGSNAKLYNKIINLDKGNNVWIKPANIKKTPFSKTFGGQADDIVAVAKDPSTSDVVQKIMNKIDKVDDFSQSGSSAHQSRYYGKGGFDGSDGGGLLYRDQLMVQQLSPQQISQNQNLLKIGVDAPQIKITELKNLIKMRDFQVKNFIKLDTLKLGIGLKTLSKQDLALRTDLKIAHLLKTDMKYDQLMKFQQKFASKTSTALKTQLKSILKLDLGSPLAPSPISKTPSIPKIKQPTIPKPFIVPFLKAKIKKGSAEKNLKRITELAYLPDFTSRALGLKAETITEKQAQAKLKKLLTGLEIRRGVKIR